jgi:hypothetical protein
MAGGDSSRCSFARGEPMKITEMTYDELQALAEEIARAQPAALAREFAGLAHNPPVPEDVPSDATA